MIKVAVVGLGYWGPKLARNFAGIDDMALTWICDQSQARLDQVASLYPSAHATLDYNEVLSSNVDAIVLATPVSTHHKLGMQALRACKHVLIEKPLADSWEKAMEIAETAEHFRLVAMVGHTFTYNPAVNTVRDLIGSGQLGRIYYINSTRANLGLLQPDINVIWDLAPHDISILLHILCLDPYEVSAGGQVYIQKRQHIHEVAHLTLYFPTGIMANIHVSWLDPVKQRKVTVVGKDKMLVYDDIAEDKVMLYDKGVEVPPYSVTPEEFRMSYRHGAETVVPVAWQEPLRLECQAFRDSIQLGKPNASDAWAGVKVVKVLETAQKSLLNSGARESTDL
ncbi:MAG TPA: Gfo/Idh/MocA family oxidoreductase [Anaerolineae bacterium]